MRISVINVLYISLVYTIKIQNYWNRDMTCTKRFWKETLLWHELCQLRTISRAANNCVHENWSLPKIKSMFVSKKTCTVKLHRRNKSNHVSELRSKDVRMWVCKHLTHAILQACDFCNFVTVRDRPRKRVYSCYCFLYVRKYNFVKVLRY